MYILRYIQSWIDKREIQSEKANLTILFDRYVPVCLDVLRQRFKKITPITDFSMLQTLCFLLESFLNAKNTPPDCPKEWYELYFVFAAVWAFGGSMFQDQVTIRDISWIFFIECAILSWLIIVSNSPSGG